MKTKKLKCVESVKRLNRRTPIVMKKLVFLLLLGCAVINKAQPYGEWSWHEHDLLLTSATYNVNNPGHLMAGHYIQGVDVGKFRMLNVDLGASANIIFDEKYSVFADDLCQTGPAFATSTGVSEIETSSLTDPYAVSGAVRDGCFFATFDAAGTPQIVKYYTFPYNAGGFEPGQTTLIEIPATLGGGFLITGSYMGYINSSIHRHMYILQLDANGDMINSSTYNSVVLDPCSNVGYELKPSSMIISPYTPNPNSLPEIIVVGEAHALGSTNCSSYMDHSEAFFMRVELNSLNWISNRFYRHSTSTGFLPEKNDFKSVVPTSFGSQNAFLLGGYSETSSTSADRAMMMMLDETGNLLWSHIYNSSYSDTRACMQVVERTSPTYGTTYYGAAISLTGGMLCFKVDGSGMPFSSSTPIDNTNEFNYQSGLGGNPMVTYQTNNLSFEPNSGSSQGIHVYGTAESNFGLTDNWYMVKASFNGVSHGGSGLCNNSSVNNQLSTSVGPNYTIEHHVNPREGLTKCPHISITKAAGPAVANLFCTSPAGATGNYSNNRTTGITKNDQNTSLSVSPNPAQNEIRIEFPSTLVSSTLRITDLNGRLVGEVPLQALNSNAVICNLNELNVSDGVYLIEAQTESGRIFTKLILQR